MIAFISDIHSNTEALGVCLDKIRSLGAERIICLGDVIGYGPEPRQTLLSVMDTCEFSLLGNHEDGCMFYAPDFNPRARAAIEWTREQLNRRDQPRDETMRMWKYLGEMRKTHREERLLLVHGSPKDPVKEYIVPRDASDAAKLDDWFQRMEDAQLCFVGHSHVPGVYLEHGEYKPPLSVNDNFTPNGQRAIVNVGSVGQPRDGDPRASFATWDGKTVTFHRVEYDVESTMRKIRAVTQLPDYLAERLAQGR